MRNGRRPDLLENVVRSLGRASGLDRPARLVVNAVARILRPGLVKDALSGTGLGHPVHPLLTDVPIGLWSGSLLLDLVGGAQGRVGARRLVGAGILAALPTIVTGLSDLSDVEDKEHRRVGLVHAAANTAALAAFTASYGAKRNGRVDGGRLWSVLGFAALTAGGYLGGHLSYRAGIGVSRTAFEHSIDEWTAAMADKDLADGQPRRVTVDGNEIMLLRKAGRVFCLANRCTHRGGPLFKGRIEGSCVVCPWHLSTFSLEDGSIVRGPATAPQPTYDVRIMGGTIEVRTSRPTTQSS